MSIWVYNPISTLGSIWDVDISPLNNGDALIYNSATWDWTATALPWGGDMLKATYDTDLDGVVDTSNDVSKSPIITRSTLASQWGLLINIDSATGDIAQTWTWWIEDEKFGFNAREFATSTSAEFDTAVLRTWTKTLKLSTLDATGIIRCFPFPWSNYSTAATNLANSHYFIPCKPSTKYRFRCFCKTTNVAATSTSISLTEIWATWTAWVANWTNTLSWTNDWTLLQANFTTAASAVWLWFGFFISVAWNISDAWFDINSMTLEEVVEPVANSLTSSSPSLVSFTAVGSTDNIDQSFLSFTNAVWIWSAAWVNYMNSQSFTATKSKHTWVTFYKKANVWTPTGDFKFEVRTNNAWDPSTTVLASYTMPLATYNALTVNSDFTVNLPCNLTAWTKYHYVLTNTATETWTNNFQLWLLTAWVYTWWDNRTSINGWTTWTLNWTSALYFKTLYYKPTTNFKASQNNSTVSISADEDGFLNWSVINLLTWTYTWALATVLGTSFKPNCFAVTDATGDIVNSFYISGSNQLLKNSSSGIYVATFKVFIPSALSINIKGTVRRSKAEWSYDNLSWNTIQDNEFSSTYTAFSQDVTPSGNYVYVRFTSGNSANSANVWDGTQPFIITASIDTTAYSRLKNYPTNKDIIKQYATTLSGATTSATYRATKWGFPAIEYSATEYQFLDVDTTATGSTVAFSSDWVTYSTVADGANIALSSTTTPLVWVKTNITANRLYLSSNDYNASEDKDGSNKMTVDYQVLSQGLAYDVLDMKDEIEALRLAVYALQNP